MGVHNQYPRAPEAVSHHASPCRRVSLLRGAGQAGLLDRLLLACTRVATHHEWAETVSQRLGGAEVLGYSVQAKAGLRNP